MKCLNGGGRGIRTLVGLASPTDFESGPFSLSGIPPQITQFNLTLSFLLSEAEIFNAQQF